MSHTWQEDGHGSDVFRVWKGTSIQAAENEEGAGLDGEEIECGSLDQQVES